MVWQTFRLSESILQPFCHLGAEGVVLPSPSPLMLSYTSVRAPPLVFMILGWRIVAYLSYSYSRNHSNFLFFFVLWIPFKLFFPFYKMGEPEIPTGLISGVVVSFVFDSFANNCLFCCLFVCFLTCQYRVFS